MYPTFLIVSLLSPPVGPRDPEAILRMPIEMPLAAETWLNGLSFSPAGCNRCVVLCFRTHASTENREREKAELVRCVDSLNQLMRHRKDVLVLGLTSEPESDAVRFVEALKPRFPVGARSTTPRRLSVKSFPTIVLLERTGDQWSVRRLEGVENLPDDWPTLLGAQLSPGVSGAATPSIEELKTGLRELKAEETSRLRDELETLRIRMKTDEFMAFCDEIEYQHGMNAAWLGRVRYERHLADPHSKDKQSDGSPVADALYAWRQDKNAPAFRKIDEFNEELARFNPPTFDGLLQRYAALITSDPADMVIRHQLVPALVDVESLDRLELFKKMLDMEPDPIIRTRLILSIESVSPPGSPATIAYLQEKLAGETNLYWVIPTLEMTLDSIVNGRNGERYRVLDSAGTNLPTRPRGY